jgi:hypothetical protein
MGRGDHRKERIRRSLILSRYPRRSDAVFTDENDHNPSVLQTCPTCRGSGRFCVESERVASTDACADCEGTGIIAATEPYFSNESPEIDVMPGLDGWLECPTCGFRFSPNDRNAWTGRRHERCGQKLRVVSARENEDA